MIVVDTHIIIWDALRPEMLSKKAKKAISLANETDGIIICDISLWEIAMLIHKGKLEVEINYLELIKLMSSSNNYVFQEITPEIAELSTKLFFNKYKDPADRIIAATSIINNARLVTADKRLRQSRKVKTIWD